MKETIKLYEQDPYLKQAKAIVIEENKRDDDLYEIILDMTIFYPTGGGQPFDKGWINDIEVVDVYKKQGIIYHVIKSSLEGSSEVDLLIDWQRRLDHMQQHSGQHVLSRAFEILFEAETVGFYLGEEIVTIDVALLELTKEMVAKVESLSNQIITENREIIKKVVKETDVLEDIKSKIPELADEVRIVEIKDFDYGACAGTHPNSTSEIGMVKIIGWEKYKQNQRVSFVCGNRSLRFFSSFQDQLMQTASILKTNWLDVAAKTSYILDEKQSIEKELKELKIKMLHFEAEEWRQKARYIGKIYWVESIFENRDFGEIRQLSQMITETSSSYVVMFVLKSEGKVQFLLQRSGDLDVPMNEALKLGLTIIDGKGGGNQQLAQGGSSSLDKMNDAIDHMRKFIFQQMAIEH